MNNTFNIINNLEQEQKVIDKDSFSFLKEIVKKMDQYENMLVKKNRKNFKYVMDEIKSLSIFIQHYENKMMVNNTEGVIINKNCAEEIFELLYYEQELNDIEWERINGGYDSSEEYYENDYNEFTGWFCGASCDI